MSTMHPSSSISRRRQRIAIVSVAALVTILLAISVWAALRPAAPATLLDSEARVAADIGLSKLPLYFEPNVGQIDPAGRFLARSSGGNILFTTSGVILSLQAKSTQGSVEGEELPVHLAGGPVDKSYRSNRQGKQVSADSAQYVVRLDFVDANPSAQVLNDGVAQSKVSYFIGNDRASWRSNVPTYKGIIYKGLYKGIDLSYSGDTNQLKGTYTVAPGADASLIRWRYTGAQKATVDEAGNLQVVVESPKSKVQSQQGATLDPVTITEQAPVAWQEIGDERILVEARYILGEEGTIGFTLGSYDPTQPLVIDPYLTYSTYLGGYGAEAGNDIEIDAQGNIYVAGYTGSPSFPFTGPLSVEPVVGPPSDVLIFKMRADGSGLEFATFLGGYLNPLNTEGAASIAIDPAGYVYVTGDTNSDDFPVVNAFQPTYGGGGWDAFVAKLTPDGSDIVYSTFLNGGESLYSNHGFGIAADSSGNAYVVGETTSSDFPVVNAFQPTFGGNSDAFITKFNPQGSALLYSTFLGGNELEVAYAVSVDAAGNAVIAGTTYSTNFPTRNPIQPVYAGGNGDAFVAKLTAAGNDLVFSTYLGGGPGDPAGYIEDGKEVALDPQGNIYVAGQTESPTFPISNAVQPSFGGGAHDGFVAKLNPGGSALIYSTYIGGSRDDKANAVAADAQGRTYVAGTTDSINLPLHDPIQPVFGGGLDAFAVLLDASGSSRVYSTYLGGNRFDYGNGVAVYNNAAYITGRTLSVNFPTANPIQPALHGSFDAYVAVISDQPPATVTPTRTGTPPTATPTLCGARSDYGFNITAGATVVPGTELVPGSVCGECIVPIQLPFPVRVYGRSFTTAYANANGYLQFTSRFVSDQGSCLPTAWLGYALLPYWDDLYAGCDAGHGIYTSVIGTAPNRIFNIEWRTRQFTFGYCGDYVNFEVQLYENSPTQQVDFVYGAVATYAGRQSVGVQMEETSYTRGTAFQCYTQDLSPGTRLTFTLPPCGINTVSPTPLATGTPPTVTATPTCSPGGGIGPWAIGPVGPGRRSYHAATSDGQYVYIFGGRILDSSLTRYANDAWRWNAATNEWTELADMPAAKAGAAATYYNGKISVMGGYNAGEQNHHFVYDIASNTWSTAALLPQPRSYAASAFYNGKVYVFGGSWTTPATAIYDVVSDSWSTGADLYIVSGASAVTASDYIYVMGGTYQEQAFNRVRRYHPNTDTWASMAPMATGRTYHVGVSDGSYIYVVNGSNAMPIPTVIPSAEKYNIATNSWSNEDAPTVSVMGAAGGLVGGKLMVYGGQSSPNNFVNLTQIAPHFRPCSSVTPTATPVAGSSLVGHVIWEARPSQPNSLQILPLTLTLKMGLIEVNYPAQMTDQHGFFTVALGSLPAGTYSWRADDASASAYSPNYLAKTGVIELQGYKVTSLLGSNLPTFQPSSFVTAQVEIGLMKTGDASDDDVVNVGDFNIMKVSFGSMCGNPTYDRRTDFTGDCFVNVSDFTPLKRNFGQQGAPPVAPVYFPW